MTKPTTFFFMVTIFLMTGFYQQGFCAEFLDWENSGGAIKRFGEKHDLKTSGEWIQWAQEKLLYDRYLKRNPTKEKIKMAALMDWKNARKEETPSFNSAKFQLKDHWHGYEFISFTYTSLDFMEQAFGIHFELVSRQLTLKQVIKRYGNDHLDVRHPEEGKTVYRYTILLQDSPEKSPWKLLQNQMAENDEVWVEFEAGPGEEVRSVEVLAVKAKPDKIPFTMNWKWDVEAYEEKP